MAKSGKCPVCREAFEKSCNRQIYCCLKCKVKARYARKKKERSQKSLPKRFRSKSKFKRTNPKKKPENPQIEISIPELKFLFKKALSIDSIVEIPCFMCGHHATCEPEHCEKLTEWLINA